MQNPAAINGNHHFKMKNLLNDYHDEQVTPAIKPASPWCLNNNNNNIDEHQEVEESLSIMDAEKELIIKGIEKTSRKKKRCIQ